MDIYLILIKLLIWQLLGIVSCGTIIGYGEEMGRKGYIFNILLGPTGLLYFLGLLIGSLIKQAKKD